MLGDISSTAAKAWSRPLGASPAAMRSCKKVWYSATAFARRVSVRWGTCGKAATAKEFIVAVVDSVVKTLYSSPTASKGTTDLQLIKDFIVITRRPSTTSLTHCMGRVAFARAALRGECAIANLPCVKTSVQPWTNGYEDCAQPGLEDVV